MPIFFNALDVAVLCMIDTPFGRYAFPQKTYEIIACGTPIVTANLGALSITLQDFPACLYEPENMPDLIEKIAAQLSSPQIPSMIIPDWKQQAGKLEKLLKAVV